MRRRFNAGAWPPRRRALLAASLLLVAPLGGCSFAGDVLETDAVETAFWAGAIVGGAAPILACAPLTGTYALCAGDDDGIVAFLLPGVPPGLLLGVALAAPVFLVEAAASIVTEWFAQDEPEPVAEEAAPPLSEVPEPVAAPVALDLDPEPDALGPWNPAEVEERFGSWPDPAAGAGR